MTELDNPARKIALLLQALDDCEWEMANYRKTYNARVSVLRSELDRLKQDILSRQKGLPLETGEPAA